MSKTRMFLFGYLSQESERANVLERFSTQPYPHKESSATRQGPKFISQPLPNSEATKQHLQKNTADAEHRFVFFIGYGTEIRRATA